MNKKIVMSLSVIAAVAAVVVGGTGAFFSDTETSTGNTFTAGAIDLKVDSKQHYNGMECVMNTPGDGPNVPATYWWQPEVGTVAPFYPAKDSSCDGTWTETDLGISHQFFAFGDVKPGDKGENTISLHVINNDAYVCATVSGLENDDNNLTEPEGDVDTTGGAGEGELGQYLMVKIWADNSEGNGWVAGDNVWQDNEPVLYEGMAQEGTWPLYTPQTVALAAGDTGYLGVEWSLPLGTGNKVQTDSLMADISFKVEQARNNPNFSCSPKEIPITRPGA